MTVYNINRGIGRASSGVEYAQAYRAKVLRKLGVPAKFLFTDLFRMENLEAMTKAMGFEDEEILWLYGAFTDVKIAPSSYRLQDLEDTFRGMAYEKSEGREITEYRFEERGLSVKAYHSRQDGSCVQRAEYLQDGKLLRIDVFTYVRIFSELYTQKDAKNLLYLRRFYHEDGRVAYEELIDGESSIFRMPDGMVDSKDELIARFLQQLNVRNGDIVLVDRATQIGRAVMEHCRKANIGVVIHAEHFVENQTDERHILWNNFYEYQFAQADRDVFYLASTPVQSALLREQMNRYQHADPLIQTIPVGSIDELKIPRQPRKKNALITASRLASEKHIDWLIGAVAIARRTVPDVSLDIYGEGGQDKLLREKIKRLQLEDAVRLMGHRDLTDVYMQYSGYLTGSLSEGFGLTLMEACGSGLPMIGFDVRYGNQTFIRDGKNGYLLPYEDGEERDALEARLAEAIVRLFTEADLAYFQRQSYQIANAYLTSEVEQSWKDFLQYLTIFGTHADEMLGD